MRKRGFTDTQISLITSFVQLDEPELIEARTEFGKLLNKFKEERADEQEKVKELGGLYIIGTERHESRRIDNQLRGRAGRQGDPGVTQFFISLEDELMRLFAGDRVKNWVDRMGYRSGNAFEIH